MHKDTPLFHALLRSLAILPWLAAVPGTALSAPAAAYDVTITTGGGQAVAINDVGQVVINHYGPDRRQSAVWMDGQLSVLSSTGYVLVAAKGINDDGVIVGDASTGQPSGGRPVRWDQGQISELAYVEWGSASGINNSGVITGSSQGRAVMWKNGSLVKLASIEGSYNSHGNAINDQEDVAGDIIHQWSDGAEWPQQPHYEYEPGVAKWEGTGGTPVVLSPYNVPGSQTGAGINNSGVVVGTSFVENSEYGRAASMFKDGLVVHLDTGWSLALGINDAEDIVGYGTIPLSDSAVAVMWSGGTRIDLNSFLDQSQIDAGWRLGTAYDINNKGWIVGSAYNTQTYLTTAFVMTPVPEPMVALMVLGGLVVVALARRQAAEQHSIA